ncbi:hypothetical protein ISI15_16370 [Burkholderia pseudomallei]|nr:hypothetical protein [Burkholderia pseudomallei]
MNACTQKALSPHDRLAFINLEMLSLTKRAVRDDKGCVFTIGVVARLMGIEEDQVRVFIDKRSADFDPEFPTPRGFFKHSGQVHQCWLARDILDYCRSLMNSFTDVQTKVDSVVRHRAAKGGRS